LGGSRPELAVTWPEKNLDGRKWCNLVSNLSFPAVTLSHYELLYGCCALQNVCLTIEKNKGKTKIDEESVFSTRDQVK